MVPVLQISPIDSYIDEDVSIKVTGCQSNTEVTIEATTYDEKEKQFCSFARFVANHDGAVDVSTQQPIAGTYHEVDLSGLFWSMKHVDSKLDDYYEKTSSNKVSINLSLIVEGEKVDSVTITRYFYNDTVKKETLEVDDVRGTLFHPKLKGTYPASIILSGSDGGMMEHSAALLASKGYVTLALPYFGSEGVPKDLENIQLEYFQKATTWLRKHPYTNGNINLIGYSRGGELALLLGATYDDYQSIIACAPSAYVTAGMKNGVYAPVTAWSLNQQPLPYLKLKNRFSTMMSTFLINWLLKRPISYLSIWSNSLKDEKAITEARIPVENIKAPVMFISGGNDQLWPSQRFVNEMEKKLTNTPQYHYVSYENAGHFLSFPYSFVNLPSNVYINVGGDMTMNFGGSKSANAVAAKDS